MTQQQLDRAHEIQNKIRQLEAVKEVTDFYIEKPTIAKLITEFHNVMEITDGFKKDLERIIDCHISDLKREFDEL